MNQYKKYIYYAIPILVSLLCLSFIAFNQYLNWGHSDDYEMLNWFAKYAETGSFKFFDLILVRHGPHFLGLQGLITSLVFKYLGVEFSYVIALNILCLFMTSVMITDLVITNVKNDYLKLLGVLIAVLLLFHPTQMNHLIWPFELGWFLVTMFIVANICILENYGVKSVAWMILISALSTISSAHGVFSWLVVSIHFLILPPKRANFVLAFLFACLFSLFSSFISHVAPEQFLPFNINSITQMATFYIQLLGGVSGYKDSGLNSIFGSLLFMVGSLLIAHEILKKSSTNSLSRSGIVLIATSMLMMFAFTISRYAYGISWAYERFHAAPLVVPYLLGITLIIIGSEKIRNLKYLIPYTLVGVISVSFITSFPYAKKLLEEEAYLRPLAMDFTCNQVPPDLYLIENANHVYGNVEYVLNNLHLLKHLCYEKLPQITSSIKKFPLAYKALGDSSRADDIALRALWRVYQVHLDLQRAFPPSDMHTPKNLIRWSVANAENGSLYEHEILFEHSKTLIKLLKKYPELD